MFVSMLGLQFCPGMNNQIMYVINSHELISVKFVCVQVIMSLILPNNLTCNVKSDVLIALRYTLALCFSRLHFIIAEANNQYQCNFSFHF